MALLDRFFVTDEIEDKFLICRVSCFPYTYSDHCHIILTCDHHRIVNRTIRFKKMWLLESKFSNLVKNKWISMNFYNIINTDNSAKKIVLKLKRLRNFLKN